MRKICPPGAPSNDLPPYLRLTWMDRIAIDLINRRARNFALSAPFIEMEQNKLRVDHRHLLEHVDVFLVASALEDFLVK